MWNKVQLGFDTEDETVNFGTRQMAAFGKSVYETSTLAIVSKNETAQTDDNVRIVPRIHCIKYYGSTPGIAIIVHETVIILGNDATDIKIKFSFGVPIDSYIIKSDGSILVVALKNGDVFCFLLHISENPIFLKNICNANSENFKTFTGLFLHDFGDSFELILTAYSGNIYILKNINVTELSRAYLSDSKESINEVIENTKLDYISINEKENEFSNILHSVEFGEANDRKMLLLVGTRKGQELQSWSANFKLECIMEVVPDDVNYRLQRLHIPRNESLLYALTDKGTVLSVCPYTLVALHHRNTIQWDACENLQEECSSFLVLNRLPPVSLQLIEMPGLNVKFQMNVSTNTHLAENQLSLDDLIYLEALTTENNVEEIESIHLKMISETQPEYRLERILRRGKFDEAELFARRFNLNLATVYKAHLQKLSNDIQPWVTSDVPIEKRGSLFKELLQKVEDTEFIGKCALNALSSDFQLMIEVLKYAESRIRTSLSNDENRDHAKLQQLYKEIRDTLFKLNTFFLVSEKPYSVDDWLSFSKTNLIEECQKFLKQGKLKEVTLIWCRHIPSVRHQLSLDQITSFFRSIPNSVTTSIILDWLRIFLPVAFSMYPEIIVNLTNWCRDKVNVMELLAEPNWIDAGIEFLKQILIIVREDVKICDSLKIVEYEYSKQSPIKDLLFYIRILKELSIMKKDHEINISVREYTQENRHEVIFNVLDRVPVEELNSFMLGFFKTLLSQENLNADNIISEYIRNLVETSVNWWYWEEAPWESRVDIMLNHVVGLQVCLPELLLLLPERLDTVLTVLKCSPVPWSATITRICDESLKHDNITSRLILEQKRMINCKLILKKYDYKDIKLIQPNFRKVVLYIFLQKRTTMLEDALQIAETFDSKLCIEVYKLWIQHLIEDEDVEKASSFLDDNNLPPNVIIACCESIILRTHALSSMPVFAAKLENYVSILDVAYNKLLQMCRKTNSLPKISAYVCKQLKDIHFMKKNYTKEVTNSNFTSPNEKEQLLKRCLNALLKDVQVNRGNVKKLGINLKELASYFECSAGKISIQFIRLALSENEFQLVVFMIRLLASEEVFPPDVSKDVIDLSSYILAYLMQNLNCTIEDDIPAFTHQLVIQALDSCPLRIIRRAIQSERWFQLMRNSPQLDTSNTLTDMEIVQSCAGSINTAKILKLLTAYCLYLHVFDSNLFIHYLSDEDVDRIMNEHKFNLIDLIKNVVEEENESVAFRFVIMMHWLAVHTNVVAEKQISECEVVVQTNTLINTCMHKVLKKLIVSRNVDTQFGSAILYHFPAEDALKWMTESIKRYKFDFQRLYALTELGLVYFQYIGREDKWNESYALRKRCTWGKLIAKYGISYKEAFKESADEQKQLLLKLMSVPSISTTLLAKYCRDMNFSFQTCLKAYLRQTLLSWQPEYEVKISTITGEKEIIVKNTYKQLLNKCLEIISLIENRQELSELLSNSMWDAINCYYYEVYLVLLTLMEENVSQVPGAVFSTYRRVFLFLSTYHRIAKPQDYEKEHWYQVHQDTQPLPSISEHRLPFRLIFAKWTKSNHDPWKIIRPELSNRTYAKWFSILDALELDKNTLCSSAVHQMLSEQILIENSEAKWCIHPRYQKLLADVRTCIDNIDSLEMATASYYYVMNHLPPGADQLMAAKLCYVQAKKWLETEPSEKATAGFNKCYAKYLTISTTHILYVHELGKPHYLQLVLKATELINALYNDPIILERNSGNVLIFPDINKAAEEISKLHRVHLGKIKLELLEEWLLPENFIVNVSYGESSHRLDGDNLLLDQFSTADRENFLKACYIVEGDIRMLGPYLVNIGFDRNGDDSKPINVRLRALRCLVSVTPKDTLEQVIGNTIERLRDHMSGLEFVSELEVLGLTYTIESFTSCNELDVIKSVLTLKSKTAFRLAARICQYFGIKSNVVWNKILARMYSNEMVTDLTDILPNLTDIFHTLDLSVFERCWNMVLVTPLEKAPSRPSENQMKLVDEILKLLRSCPVIDRINLEVLKENCSRIGSENLINEIDSLKF